MLPAPDARSRYARARIVFCLAAAAAVVALWLLESEISSLPLRAVCGTAALFVAVALIALVRLTPRGVWSLTSIYAVVFLLFHFGLVTVYGTGLPIEDEATPRHLYHWFYSTTTRRTVLLSTAGFLAFAAGSLAASRISFGAGRGATDTSAERNAFNWAGLALTVGAIGLWGLFVMMSGGPSLLTGGYLEFLDATKDLPLGATYYVIGTGMMLLVVGRPGHVRNAGMAAFAAWAMVVFPLGLRGEVLFITATALGVAAMTKPPFPARNLLIAALPCMIAISFVREYRATGLDGATVSLNSVNPLWALTELGSSLRPVNEVVNWADEGEPFLYGETIVAPFDRTLTKFIPVGRRVPGDEDERIGSVLVLNRVGPIGFSPVAEGYRNGGIVGVLLLLGLTGIVIGSIDFAHPTPLRQVVAGVLFMALLIEVRNDFYFVPIYVTLGWVIVLSVHWFYQAYAGGRRGGR